MARTSVFEVTVDTSHFTPLQLQPRALLSLSFNALSRWLREHLVSFPELIRRHRRSVVILGARIDYEAPWGFFDGAGIDVTASLKVLRAGTRAELRVTFTALEATAAAVWILLCPVEIVDPVSLAATPAAFDGALLAAFQPDEIDPAPPRRTLPSARAEIEAQGVRLAEAGAPFVVHRHMCEVADQWAFFEVPALVGASRESMALSMGEGVPLLHDGLSRPLRRFEMELTRPYFWFQTGSVETTAYRHDSRLTMLHVLRSPVPGGDVHGVAVEWF
jgi:hypothetical protein